MTFKTLLSTATLATALTTALMTSSAFAADITVSNPWARASAGMANAGAAFMTINNAGAADTLVAAKAGISQRIELHTHTMVDGVMKMREVEGGIPVPANGMQMLQPGGYHVMFMGLDAPLKEGSSFPLTLSFKSGAEVAVDVQVMSPAAMGGAMDHGNMGNMGQGNMGQGNMGQGGMNQGGAMGEGMKHGHQ